MLTRRPIRALLAVTLVTGLFAASCSSSDPEADPGSTTTTTARPGSPGAGVDGAGAGELAIRLSTGAPIQAVATTAALVDGEPLDDAAIESVYARLPEWLVDDDQPAFRFPAETLRPPLVGDTVETPFPAEGSEPPVDVPSGPLQVLRFQPEGEVSIAPYLSVTFDQPMVELATVDQLASADVPVIVTPDIDGRWRWIGTRTLRFEVEPGLVDRLPMATEFTVEIPAGTTSATGGELAESVSFTFTTPPVQVENLFPMHDSLALEPLFFASFDQVVDPDAVLATTTLTVDGQEVAVRLATDAEVAADDDVRAAVEGALDQRWLAFRPVEPLPTDSAVRIVIGPGTPSVEGPRLTEDTASFDGRTYAPLAVDDRHCWSNPPCEPGSPLTVVFNNQLDLEAFDESMVTVEPELAGRRVQAYGSQIEIVGDTRGRVTYAVTFTAGLADVFGQTLGDETTVEFDMGSARPMLRPLDRAFVTLDPLAAEPALDVVSVNHDSLRVRAFDVEPSEYATFTDQLDRQYDENPPSLPDWPELLDTTVDVDADEDAQVETAIVLSDAVDRSTSGQLVVIVEPTREFPRSSDDWWQNRPIMVWVQSTTLGIDAFLDNDELYLWTTDLTTGDPVGGVEVELVGTSSTVTTDVDGLATAQLSSTNVRSLAATVDGATSMLPSGWYEGWERQESNDQGRWYVFDDRGIYRPGETVRLKGWLRRLTTSDDARLEVLDGSVDYRAHDPQGNELATGEASLNALGGFDLTFDIPDGANLGTAWVELGIQGYSATHELRIEEFRRPEFEVTTRTESPGPFLANEPLTVAVEAAYYAGGPLPDAAVEWTVSSSSTTYEPPNHPDFTFGIWQPWWYAHDPYYGDVGFAVDYSYGDCFDGCFGTDPEQVERFSGRTDGAGAHYLQMDFEAPDVDLPSTVTAQATVTDVNRQELAGRSDLVVHPADVYVGVRTDRTFVRQGEPVDVELVVTDIDGAFVAGRGVTVTASRVEWQYVDGEWTEVDVDPQECDTVSEDGPVTCSLTIDQGGQYRITAIVTDETGRPNRSEITRWVSGGDIAPPTRDVEAERVTIVPDAETHEPGSTAELLVQAPFSPASGVMTLTRNGIVSVEAFDAPDGTAVLEVPITDALVPNVTVDIEMVGTAPRLGDDGEPLDGAPPRPAYATGRVDLTVAPITRTLSVVATPSADTVEPGTDTSVSVAVTDAAGEPVAGAELAVVVVDEAVLALTGYELADPIGVFYAPISGQRYAEHVRSSILLADPERFSATGGDATDDGGDGAAEGELAVPTTVGGFEESAADGDFGYRSSTNQAGSEIDVRVNFDALAVYAPSETTDADGTVTVDVPLPDNLTRYRIMAVAVDGAEQFGSGEANITARLPLMVRPSAPRFLNFGDTFELPVVVQNQTDVDVEVDVVVQTSNLTLTEGAGRRVSVPANDRVEVRFPAEAADVGTARFRAAAVTADAADAATVELPVYTPATTEAFATYGVVDEGAVAQPVLAPTGVIEQFGGLEVQTSSTALQALTDAVLYLTEYRYDSADAYASRILAVAALRDVLDAFAADGLPDADELEASVADDITSLVGLQNDDGGFGAWRRDGRSDPYRSLHVAHALVAARAAGYGVPDGTHDRALDYLRNIENHFPADYSQSIRDMLTAYALNVRNQAGDRDSAGARSLYQRAKSTLGLDAVAWLWPLLDDAALDAEIERLFANRATETAGAATFTTGYGEEAYLVLASDRRTDGIVLDALIGERPDSDLIPKVVAGLLGNQVKGRWNNAQENAFILLALHRYFVTYEDQTPDFVARVWLGDTYAAEHTYEGRTTDRGDTLVPMETLIEGGDSDIVVAKDGDGRLYYRLGLKYAPDDLTLDPRDDGFVVDRVYEAIDDPDDVRLDADGVWHIAAGADVRVRLTMVADARRTNVALVDPLPAGFEPLNPALAVSAEPPIDPAARASTWCWCWRWYDHQNLRDDRAEAFTTYLWAGTHEYTYVARATTPGTFVVPPTRAEEMYAPEVFGRTATATVIVEDGAS